LSPKSIVYKANSIIYFKGDISDKIFILNEGQISLNSINIETGADIHELIKTGEFFGVKSSLGRYPREETAVVLSDSKVVAFSVPEFEQLASMNTRVILKMLKVFSNQLRRIHKQVQSLLNVKEQVNAEQGLYTIGAYYLNNNKFKQAIYAFDRYLLFYPSGSHVEAVTRNIKLAKEKLEESGGQDEHDEMQVQPEVKKVEPERKASTTNELTSAARDYYNAVSFMGRGDYEHAAELFKKIIAANSEEEYLIKSQFEIGKCLFYLKKYDKCLQVFSGLIQKYPKHPDFIDILDYIAQCNEARGETVKALALYKKILSMAPPSDPIYNKVNRALKALERA